MSETPQKLKPIRSYVRRERRMNYMREEAFNRLWEKYGLDVKNPLPNNGYILEIGFGYGDALIASAIKNPDKNYIGIEVYRPGVEKIFTLIDDNKLTNVKVYHEDAMLVLNESIPDNSLEGVRLCFPDPWPKRRHYKRRLVNPNFIDLIYKKLKVNGFFHFASDWEDYVDWTKKLFQSCGVTLAILPFNERMASVTPERPMTNFARAGIAAGRKISDLIFVKL